MKDSFLTDQEKDYILDKAEFLKVSALLEEIVKKLEEDFNSGKVIQKYKPEISDEVSVEKLEVSLYLDNVTPESLEEVFPVIKKHLAKYHQLRIHQREIEKRLYRVRETKFDVVEKK